jgi:hypothetical protein
MSALSRLLAYHARAMSWTGAGIAVLILAGGFVLGAEQAGAPQPEFQTQQTSVRLPAARHSVVGEVRAVGTGEMLVRGPKGALFAIRLTPAAQFRASGRPFSASDLKPGDHVVVIGRPAADGSLIANRVTLTPVGRTQGEAVQR